MRDNLGNPFFSGRPEFARGIMLIEDCEGAFNWVPLGTGGDDVHEFAASAAFTGSYGLKLQTRTTGSAEDDDLSVGRQVSYPESGLIVVRLQLDLVSATATKTAYIRFMVKDGTNYHYAAICYTPGTPSIAYLNSAGTYTNIAALAHLISPDTFTIWEMILDLRTLTYISAAINGLRASLSGTAFQTVGALAGRGCGLEIGCTATAAGPASIAADNIYIGEYLEL